MAYGLGDAVVLAWRPPRRTTRSARTAAAFGSSPRTIAVALFVGIAIANRRAYVRLRPRRRPSRTRRRRVDEERLRIARELHDVVAHTMATITVQAAAAAQLLRDRPDEAAESLKAIRAASKDGLRELRAILDVLRQADEPPTRRSRHRACQARRPRRRGPRRPAW